MGDIETEDKTKLTEDSTIETQRRGLTDRRQGGRGKRWV